MTDATKAIGSPVFTWQGHIGDLLSAISATEDTKELASMAKALLGANMAATGRRDALRAVKGKGLLDPE